MSDARERLYAALRKATPISGDLSPRAAVDALLAHPDDLLALLVEAGALAHAGAIGEDTMRMCSYHGRPDWCERDNPQVVYYRRTPEGSS